MNILKKIVGYICVFFMIMQCNTCMVLDANEKQLNLRFTLYALICLSALVLMNNCLKLKKSNFIVLVAYLFTMAVLTIFGKGFANLAFFVNYIIAFVLFYLLVSNTSIEQYLEILSNIIFCISCVSLFFFLFASTFHVIEPSGELLLGWGGVHYVNNFYNLYYEVQPVTSFFYSGYRNTAIFSEGLMFAYPLLLSLYYELFLHKKKLRKGFIVVYTITIFTTFTTFAYIIFSVIALMKVYHSTKRKSLSKYLLVPIASVIAVLFVINVFNDKLYNNAVSINVHADDILASLKCFLHNPIFGIGYENISGLDKYRLVMRENAGLSTGLGGILAFGGIVLGIWYVAPFVAAIKRYILEKNLRDRMGFVIISVVLIAAIVIHTKMLTTMIIAICWSEVLKGKSFSARRIKQWGKLS